MISPRALALALACLVSPILLALATPTSAKADWEICNYTSYVVETAVGYRDGGQVWTEGWVRVRPGECTIALNRDLIPGEHYLYARSSDAHQGGRRIWADNVDLCVDEVEQTFAFSNGVRCEIVGASTRSFARITVDSANWQTALNEPQSGGPGRRITQQNARAAGLQRLLSDAGYYDARRIDGIPGRRTENAISNFLRSIGRSRRPSDLELIDLLERQASATASSRGLTVCNRLSEDVEANLPIWTALATRRGDAWESRGWWVLMPTECRILANIEMSDAEYYIYADRSQSVVNARPLVDGEESFCLTRGRFAINGRTRCTERGYTEGRFVRVDADDDAVTIEFQAEDFDPDPNPQSQGG